MSDEIRSADELRQEVKTQLDRHAPDAGASPGELVQQALEVAAALQRRAAELQTPQERRQQAELDRMIHHAGDKATLMELTDQAFRSRVPHRAADQLIHILDVQGVPRFFSAVDRTLLKGFQSFGSYLPGVVMPFVKEKMHHETANVILPAEDHLLFDHLRRRHDEGLRMNVNVLGEALLGEEEANRRLQGYLHQLQQPDIEVISVKISTIYSQISPVAREHTVAVLCDRLELLYRAALKSKFISTSGAAVSKLVYLDMEEYRDKDLTVEAFTRTLERPGLESARAGIALQAYLPDSHLSQRQIHEWARRRHKAGGSPITVRIVKGANMEMERVEASLRGWPQAPYKQKIDTDANYKRMVLEGLRPENDGAVRLGIASHNLFDLAFAYVAAARADALANVHFEMLEGMANHQRRAMFELAGDMLLYAPACRQEDFIHAIGYLVRRLDENTGADNFLRHAFRIQVETTDWRRLAKDFVDSVRRIESVSSQPRREQDRRRPVVGKPPQQAWTNEPDTDFSLPHHALWAAEIVDRWKPRCDLRAANVPLVLTGTTIEDGRQAVDSTDPSRPGVVVARGLLANATDVQSAVAHARQDPTAWRTLSVEERRDVLHRVAHELRAARADLIGAAMAEGGKTIIEADIEVSEAVDFAGFYAESARYFQQLPDVKATPRGVVVVLAPWNFPIAIPCGGVAAALAAGNTVILKPATDTIMVAYEICRCFWKAGVSESALQFLPCRGSSEGQLLAAHDDVDAVILTGGTATAHTMLANKPSMQLVAETGGKNATIVTSLADRDQAVKNVIHSAFSHSGQKCSATSLLILEREVYYDTKFRDALVDATESLRVGSVWDLENKMGPLIRPPSGELEAALKVLEQGESWAVMSRHLADNPQLFTAGIKWDVSAGSVTHMTEFFGPLLGVMMADHLPHAVELVNQTGYGLTSGLESLDDREHDVWRSGVRAGNLYINRPTTGAVVLRQPFGGMGKSAFGPGIKAGGPNYVVQLMDVVDGQLPISNPIDEDFVADDDIVHGQLLVLRQQIHASPHEFGLTDQDGARLDVAIASYLDWSQREFSQQHDACRLLGEDNYRRYLPIAELRVRVAPGDTQFQIMARVAAARSVGCRITVSAASNVQRETLERLNWLTENWAASIEFVEESDDDLANVIRQRHTDRVRFAAADRVPDCVRAAAAETGIYIADRPVSGVGRVELLWYLQEQSVCHMYHRYGNLGRRSTEARAEPM